MGRAGGGLRGHGGRGDAPAAEQIAGGRARRIGCVRVAAGQVQRGVGIGAAARRRIAVEVLVVDDVSGRGPLGTTLLLLALIGMATLLTALVIIAIVAMPMMVRLVAREEYADLVPAHGGSIVMGYPKVLIG